MVTEGADLNQQIILRDGDQESNNRSREQSVLTLAIMNQAPEDIIIQLITPDNINNQMCPALVCAVTENQWDLVPTLMQQGADRNQRYASNTPLTHAIINGAPQDVVTQLITPQNINDDEYPALVCAVECKYWDLIPLLIQLGADINIQNKQGLNAIDILIIKNPWRDIKSWAELLLEHGGQTSLTGNQLHYHI